MESRLRRVRKQRGLTLENVVKEMSLRGVQLSPSQLSLIERGTVWPSKHTVNGLIELFGTDVNRLEILFPFEKIEVEHHDVA